MKYKVVLLFLGFLLIAPQGFAEIKEADLPRDEEGVIIQRDQRLKIAEDRKVYQVSSNVVRTEELSDYLARRMTQMEQAIADLQKQVKHLEASRDELAKQLEEQENKKNKVQVIQE